jgi:ATP-dependent protease ClpP protease subunit
MGAGIIQIQPGQVTYVSFTSDVNPSSTEALLAVMGNLAQQKVQTVYFVLSTPGGQVASGLTIYNFLRGVPFKLITHNIGNVDSIGNAIFLAGQERYVCPNATFMFHGVGFDINTSMRFEEKFLKERLGAILSDQRRIGQIIQDRTSIPQAEVESLFLEQQTKDAAYARSKGIVDDVREFQLPAGAPIIQLVFKR